MESLRWDLLAVMEGEKGEACPTGDELIKFIILSEKTESVVAHICSCNFCVKRMALINFLRNCDEDMQATQKINAMVNSLSRNQ